LLLLAGCSSPKLQTPQTASQQFSTLGSNHDKAIAKNFYSLGAGDAARRWYWSNIEGRSMSAASLGDAQAVPPPDNSGHQ
jgi:hypothetical protein